MAEETRYCPHCANTTAEWGRDSENQDVCLDCGSTLYDDYDVYREEMIDWLGDRKGMTEDEVVALLAEHGNPGKGQALAILRNEGFP